MEGGDHNFGGTFEGSASHMEAHQVGYGMLMSSAMRGIEQHGMMHPGGHFSPTYGGNPQYMPQGYAPNREQPQVQPVDDGIEPNDQDDDVEEIPASQVPVVEGKKKGACHRGSGFVVDEDRVLCSGWLNISKDATTDTNQDKVAFYKRLQQYYLDNYDPNSNRTVNSIQKRWSTIQTWVSRFCAILSRIERLNQSGKNYQDMVNDAVKIFQEKEPWKFDHCWIMLRDEPKWNEKVLEIMQPQRGQNKQGLEGEGTQTQSDNDVSSNPDRPEGRDSAKKRKASRFQDTSGSSVAVDMQKQFNERGQQMDEIDSKHKEELVMIERAKFELAQKQLQVKMDMSMESNRLTRELTQEKLKLQKEMKEAELKVQMHAIDVEQIKVDTQIMFTDASKLADGLREWVLKRQMDIMIRDGVRPAGAGSSSNGS